MPTMTRTRCASFGYWCTTKGGRLTVNDFIRLQGFEPSELPRKGMVVSAAELAGALGNSMSLNVVMALLPKALYCAGSSRDRRIRRWEVNMFCSELQ